MADEKLRDYLTREIGGRAEDVDSEQVGLGVLMQEVLGGQLGRLKDSIEGLFISHGVLPSETQDEFVLCPEGRGVSRDQLDRLVATYYKIRGYMRLDLPGLFFDKSDESVNVTISRYKDNSYLVTENRTEYQRLPEPDRNTQH